MRVTNAWGVVFASTLGLMVTQGPVMTFSFGVFLPSFESEFGWNRGQISLALTLTILSAAVVMPIAGRLLDSIGARRFTLWALVIFGASVMSLYFVPGNLALFYAWFVVIGLLAAGAAPGPFARAVSAWFDRKRGFALGLCMAGVGIGAAMMPLIARSATAAFGWRGAYVVIGCLILAVIPFLFWLLHNDPADVGGYVDNDPDRDSGNAQKQLVGMTRREAFGQRTFWLLLAAFVIAAFTINGTTVHLVPLLLDRGVTFETAAGTASFIGLALIFGRVLAGYLLDRVFAPYVAIGFLTGPILGMIILAQGGTGATAILSAALLGLGIGAEVDLIAYMASRYFGLKSFGEIYGYLFGVFIVGTGLGPLVTGIAFDRMGDYNTIFIGYAVLLGLSCLLMLRLGNYPDYSGRAQGPPSINSAASLRTGA
jgi:MFS family permease